MAESNLTVEYRSIPGYPGYRAGSDGSIWSCFRGPSKTENWKKRKPGRHRQNKKYLYVHLWTNGRRKTKLVHHLILESFVGPRPYGMQCRHLDGDPTNNAINNLAWGTHKENTQDTRRLDRFHRILNENQVREIRDRFSRGERQKDIARDYGTSPMNISSIINRASWNHID